MTLAHRNAGSSSRSGNPTLAAITDPAGNGWDKAEVLGGLINEYQWAACLRSVSTKSTTVKGCAGTPSLESQSPMWIEDSQSIGARGWSARIDRTAWCSASAVSRTWSVIAPSRVR